MSHEIRTPMNAILGFSQLVSSENLISDERKNFSQIIQKSCNQLLDILTNVIEISQIQGNHIQLTREEVNIETILHKTEDNFTPKCIEKNIKLFVLLQLDNSYFRTMSDSYKLIKILSHLIDNAIKFSNSGGIIVKCRLDKNNFYEFSVSDSGIGISTEMQKKIFEPFRQVETGLSRNFGGNGVGLSIAKAYVELLGGQIWLQSDARIGTTFYFTVPYKPTETEIKSEELSASKLNLSNKTILIADDELVNIILFKKLLSETNANILSASNGLEAIDQCRNINEIDLVLMDIKMPEMDGQTAMKQIKDFRPGLP
ncbi:MAG: ATP-binding protein, partial [Methanobacterium sp.]